MNKKEIKIAIIANVVPKYREGFYEKILKNKKFKIKIFCQKSLPTPIETSHTKFKKNVKLLNYFSFGNEKIVITKLPIIHLIRNYDLFVVEGNPRYISHFIFATILILLRKKVILWTMAHSSADNKFREYVRLKWTKLFKYLYVYTDFEKFFLKKKGFNNHVIYPMNNGLNLEEIDKIKKNFYKNNQNRKTLTFLSCSRLLKKNRFDLAINAFAKLKENYKFKFKYILIGTGDQEKYLKSLVKDYGLQNYVEFKGKIYDEKKLAPYFMKSVCLIHPSSIGLSLIHAFSYGLPVITHSSKLLHNPEIAAFKNNYTGFFFKINDVNSLKNKIKKFFEKKNLKNIFRLNCYNIVKNKYNSFYMAKNFFKLVDQLNKG